MTKKQLAKDTAEIIEELKTLSADELDCVCDAIKLSTSLSNAQSRDLTKAILFAKQLNAEQHAQFTRVIDCIGKRNERKNTTVNV